MHEKPPLDRALQGSIGKALKNRLDSAELATVFECHTLLSGRYFKYSFGSRQIPTRMHIPRSYS
jgi:hypothetical protein